MQPNSVPTGCPSLQPSGTPSVLPSSNPTISHVPSTLPSSIPSSMPTWAVFVDINDMSFQVVSEGHAPSLRIEVALSEAIATAYCAVFVRNPVLNARFVSAVSDIEVQNYAGFSSNYLASVIVPNLSNSTAYRVYCSTVSASGVKMPFNVVLKRYFDFSTPCCKTAILSPSQLIVFPGDVAVNALQFRMSALPSQSVSIQLFVISGNLSINLFPSQFTITEDSDFAFTLISVGALVEGTASIGAYLSGPSSDEYGEVSSISVRVLSSDDQPPVPRMKEAVFAPDGSFFRVVFDAPTSRGGHLNLFQCDFMFNFSDISSSKCSWNDDSSVYIWLSSSSTLKVYSPITLLSGVLTALCDTSRQPLCAKWSRNAEGSVSLTAPSSPSTPMVQIIAPPATSDCVPLSLDLSGSTGSGRRAWSSVKIDVYCPSVNCSQLQSLLNQIVDVSSPILIPSNYLTPSTYTFVGALCNFLGACGKASSVIRVLVTTPPIVSVGKLSLNIERRESLKIRAKAQDLDCQGVIRYSTLRFNWTAYSEGRRLNLRSESLDKSVFLLSPFSLQVFTQYSVILTVLSLSTFVSSTTEITVSVIQGNVVALINGGSTQSVRAGHQFLLDGSYSYDTDVPSSALPGSDFNYTWSCVQRAPLFRLQCPDITFRNESIRSPVLVGLPDVSSSVNSSLAITLTFSCAKRRAAATANILIVEPFAAVILLSSSIGTSDIDVNENFVLSSSIQSDAPVLCEWSSNDNSMELSAISRTPTTLSVVSSKIAYLVLPPGSLSPRSSLIFSLTCGRSMSSIQILTNGPPLPGYFSVLPAIGGIELSTYFRFLASYWNDENLPLKYQFGFLDSSQRKFILQSTSESSNFDSLLPSGSAKKLFQVSCFGNVFDDFGVNTSTYTTVEVLVSDSEVDIVDFLASSNGDSESTKVSLYVGLSVMTTVNCSGVRNCDKLNRYDCSVKSFSCGDCLPGFIGESGSGDAMCVNSSLAFSRERRVGEECLSSDDCGVWEHCDDVSNVCLEIEKSCSKSCLGGGVCSYVDLLGQRVDSCKLRDISCSSVCVCYDGYFGHNCELTVEEVDRKRQINSVLLDSLLSLTASEDPTAENFESWISCMNSIGHDPYLLDVNAISKITHVCSSILDTAIIQVIPTRILNGITSALDVGAEALSVLVDGSQIGVQDDEVSSLTSTVVDLLGKYGQVVVESMFPGESAQKTIGNMFRVTSSVHAETANISVTTPLTVLEQLSGHSFTQIYFSGAASGDTIIKSTSLITRSGLYGNSSLTRFRSDPVQFQVFGLTNSNVTNPPSVRFVIQNEIPQPTSHVFVNETFVTTCEEGHREVFNYSCSSSAFVIRHNCSGSGDILTSKCPNLVSAASCGSISDLYWCETVNFTATNTTCVCSMRVGKRRLDTTKKITSSVASSAVVTLTIYEANQFAGTLSAAASFDSIADVKKVIIVILIFGTLWSGGLFLLFSCTWRKELNKRKSGNAKLEHTRKLKNAKISKSPVAIREFLLNYVSEVFPVAFRDKSKIHRIKEEIAKHHRYLVMFTAGGEVNDQHRILVGFQLLTVQTMLMFLLALFYDLQGPDDDGSCVNHLSEESCLVRKSILDKHQFYCQWNLRSNRCSYSPPSFSWLTILYVSIVISMVTAIVNYPIDTMFELLSAPTADTVKVKNADTALKRIGRRMSNAARRVSVAASEAVQAAIANTDRFRKQSLIGYSVRSIPDTTQEAYDLAVASAPVIKHRATEILLHRAEMLAASEQYSHKNRRYEDYLDSDDEDGDEDGDESEAKSESLERSEGRGGRGTFANFVSSLTGKKSKPNDVLSNLRDEIDRQRHYLKPSELEEFDAAWGIDPTGEFCKSTVSLFGFSMERDSARTIENEIQFVQNEANKKIAKLSLATDEHAGLEILHLFILDVLGRETAIARIFESKFSEDFRHEVVVTRFSKAMAMLALFCMNFVFIYYTVLRGFVKGIGWQRSFLAGCIVQFVVEILLNETVECLWVNFLVPDLVSSEVNAVSDLLRLTVEKLCCSKDFDQRHFLDTPKYLFVSTNVAKKYPNLLESMIVNSYQNHLPGELSKKWHFGSVGRINRPGGFRGFFLSLPLIAVLQFIGASPFVFQRIIIRLIQPWILTALTLMFYNALKRPIALAFTLFGIIALSGFSYWYLSRNRIKSSNEVADEPVGDDSSSDSQSSSSSESSSASSVGAPAAPESNEPSRNRLAYSMDREIMKCEAEAPSDSDFDPWITALSQPDVIAAADWASMDPSLVESSDDVWGENVDLGAILQSQGHPDQIDGVDLMSGGVDDWAVEVDAPNRELSSHSSYSFGERRDERSRSYTSKRSHSWGSRSSYSSVSSYSRDSIPPPKSAVSGHRGLHSREQFLTGPLPLISPLFPSIFTISYFLV